MPVDDVPQVAAKLTLVRVQELSFTEVKNFGQVPQVFERSTDNDNIIQANQHMWFELRPQRTSSSRWKLAEAEWRPNGITQNCINSFPGIVKAVMGFLVCVSDTCQYPFLRSRVDRYCAPCNLFRIAIMLPYVTP